MTCLCYHFMKLMLMHMSWETGLGKYDTSILQKHGSFFFLPAHFPPAAVVPWGIGLFKVYRFVCIMWSKCYK